MDFEVVIIGAGVIGLAIGKELSKKIQKYNYYRKKQIIRFGDQLKKQWCIACRDIL